MKNLKFVIKLLKFLEGKFPDSRFLAFFEDERWYIVTDDVETYLSKKFSVIKKIGLKKVLNNQEASFKIHCIGIGKLGFDSISKEKQLRGRKLKVVKIKK